MSTPDVPTSPLLPSEGESSGYFYGLSGRYRLLARSNIAEEPWGQSEFYYGYSQFPDRMAMKNIGQNEVQEKWNSHAVYDIRDILERSGKRWNHCHLLRLGHKREGKYNPVVLVGVERGSTSQVDANDLVNEAKNCLANHGILSGVPVLVYEASVWDVTTGPEPLGPTPLGHMPLGPKLLDPVGEFNATADVRQPFTHTLGQCIAPYNAPRCEGTLGFYMAKSDDPEGIYGVTCRQVLEPDLEDRNNQLYEYMGKGEPLQYVILPGDTTLDRVEDKIKKLAEKQQSLGEHAEWNIKEATTTEIHRKHWEINWRHAQRTIVECQRLLEEIGKWRTLESRKVGHIVYSPPMESFPGLAATCDVCVLKFDKDKFTSPPRNVVHLGAKYSVGELMGKLNPHPECKYKIEWPDGLLMELRDPVKLEELERPDMLNEEGENCLLVFKYGRTTGLTMGYTNEAKSLRKVYLPNGQDFATMEFGVMDIDRSKGTFSERGDSGSVIFDKTGRMVGLLTAGSGSTDTTDVTFLSPIIHLVDHLKNKGFHLKLVEEFK